MSDQLFVIIKQNVGPKLSNVTLSATGEFTRKNSKIITNQLCPYRYPFTPGWREAIMVKCLPDYFTYRKELSLYKSYNTEKNKTKILFVNLNLYLNLSLIIIIIIICGLI